MFGQTPEQLENVIGECIMVRDEALSGFRGLGPPDLIELIKATKSKTQGVYHSVTGVDVSSAASIAAYITTLRQPLGEGQLWFGRAQLWRIVEATYCTFNAFSRIDVRVNVSFPGGTDMQIMTLDGSKHDVDSMNPIWPETYMSAMIRCLLLKDSDMYVMDNTRHEFPFDSDGVRLFLSTFAELYSRGSQVGAGPWVQTATLSCNYMVDALLVLLDATGAYKEAIEMLGKLEDAKEVMAKVLLRANQEVNAVSLLVNTAERDPRNAQILAMEAEFCLSKNQLDLALDCAERARAARPSDQYPWEVLCKIYIAQERWTDALLALNSTPLIPWAAMDVVRMPPPKKIHRPLPQDGVLEEAWNFNADTNDPVTAQLLSVRPELSRLPASQIRGTTAKTYALLATINHKIGWKELMRLRHEVFWMNTEHRDEDTSEGSEEDGSEVPSSEEKRDGQQQDNKKEKENEATANGKVDNVEKSEEAEETTQGGHSGGERDNSNEEKPEPQPMKVDAQGLSGELAARRSLRSKRLCEWRIDRLVFILYEDTRAYLGWQREAIHLESQQLPFDKSAAEWQMFGQLAQRLLYHDQARKAFSRSMSMYFSARSMSEELTYEPYNIELIVKLMSWNHRWYNEFSPRLMGRLRELVARDGLAKVRVEVEMRFRDEKVVDLVHIELDRLARLKVVGFDL